jgi:serine phosphatase RsbU (regulator of sigma subunit)
MIWHDAGIALCWNMNNHNVKTVLVIEDEPIIRQAIADFLEDCDYRVIQAEHGRRGLELFREHTPDVVLTDLRMPLMGGREVLAVLNEEFPETPVIVVSGVGDIRDAIDAVHLGAWDYIIKPVQDLEIIVHAIERCIERARLIKENREYRESLERAKVIFDRDMRMAVNVQKNYLPRKAPESDEWEIAFEFRPMAGVSGDFYDFYEKAGKIAGVSLFDVSGHGIASGLVTMIAKSVVFRGFTSMAAQPLKRVMESINLDLINEINSMDNYLTGVLLRFSGSHIEYVNAAHPPLLHRHATGAVEQVGISSGYQSGRFLGISSLSGEYEQYSFDVSRDDMLLLYSDCLVESINPKKERFGIGKVSDFLSAVNPTYSCRKIIQGLIEEFNSYLDTEELPDDLTVILIKRLV